MNARSEKDLISVIMPVHNGSRTLSRALRSIQRLTYNAWEVIAIDDGSADASFQCLRYWERQDRRIQAVHLEENLGPSAARNEALRRAKGAFVAYLDCDDEFHPNYLDLVAQFQSKGAVLIFGYDVVDDERPEGPPRVWDPTPYKNVLFDANIATPLGVAHRRDLALQVGGFDEDLWALEDWDLWRRMARTGVEFLFIPFRSGIYHKRESSRSCSPCLTSKQRQTFASRLETGKSLYASAGRPARPVQQILLWTSVFPFVGDACPDNDGAGAAHLLTRAGFACQAFCPSKLVGRGESKFERVLERAGLTYQAQDTTLRQHSARMIYTRSGDVPVSIFETHSTRQADYRDGEVAAILDYFEKCLLAYRPDAIIAYGPGWQPDLVFDLASHVAKAIDIPLVLWLDHGTAINTTVIQSADYCVVVADHSRQQYWDAAGLLCQTLPHAFDWDQARLRARDPQSIIILARDSGAEALFASKIAEDLGRARPDMRISSLHQNLDHGGQAAGYSWTDTPGGNGCEARLSVRAVLSRAMVLVVPSLGHGLFDRTVAEAMINGIPVVVSNRGALPETVGAAGRVVEIPSYHQPGPACISRPDDVSPWQDAVIRLLDDPALCREVSDRSLAHSLCWHPSRTIPIYSEFFRNLRRQPGPPLLPKWSDKSLEGLQPVARAT